MATTVLNKERLKRKLIAIPDAVKAEIRLAMEQSAQEIVDLAKRLVPIDSGALQDSIGWTWGDPPTGAIVIATSSKGPKDLQITIYAGDDKAFYARWVEFGVRGSEKAAAQPPRPFFFPAYRTVRRRVRGRVTRAVRTAAKKVAGNV